MRIVLHGGNYCGVKHITDLGGYPEMKLAARVAVEPQTKKTSFKQSYHDATNDMRSRYPTAQNEDFFNAKAPAEEYHKRLKRLLAFLKKNRPHHCVEIILSNNQKA